MEKLKFTYSINASKEKVWNTLWDDETYRKWTSAFSEGSYAESDWNEGSRIVFLSPGGNGMFGVIDKKIPYQQMTFKHLGEVKDGKDINADWAGALESYFLTESNGLTELTVEMDINKEFESYFKETFPKAIAILKQIAEESNH